MILSPPLLAHANVFDLIQRKNANGNTNYGHNNIVIFHFANTTISQAVQLMSTAVEAKPIASIRISHALTLQTVYALIKNSKEAIKMREKTSFSPKNDKTAITSLFRFTIHIADSLRCLAKYLTGILPFIAAILKLQDHFYIENRRIALYFISFYFILL